MNFAPMSFRNNSRHSHKINSRKIFKMELFIEILNLKIYLKTPINAKWKINMKNMKILHIK
jgi:hypothetical protein